MKNKILITIYMLFLILFSFSSYGADPGIIDGVVCTNTPILNDTFTYSDAYTNHDWDLFSTTTFAPIPPSTPYNNQSFGFNGSYSAIDFFHDLRFFHSSDFTSGTYVISFDISQGVDSITSGGNSAWWFRVTDKDSNVKAEIKIGKNDDLSDHEIFGCVPSWVFVENTTSHIDIIMNLDTDRTSVYFDNVAYGCDNLNTTVDELGGINLLHFHSAMENTDRQTDNVVICQGHLLGNFTLDTSDTEDWAVQIDQFWDDVGVKSSVSRFLFALIFMIVIAFTFFEMHIVSKTQFGTASVVLLIIIEFFVSILCVYLQLLPVWIIFLYVFFCGGIGFLIFKSTMAGG